MGFFSDIFGGDKSQVKATRAAEETLRGVRVPTRDELMLELDRLVLEGELTPQEARTFLLEQTAFEDIDVDPRYRGAQLDALGGYQEIVDAEGLDPRFLADLRRAERSAADRLRGDIAAIGMQEQERGGGQTGVGGFGRAARLLSAQSAANRMSQTGLDTAATAANRRERALGSLGALGGQLEDREYGQQAAAAKARDLINQMNAAARQETEYRNVDARTEADQFNLTRRDKEAAANLEQSNEMARRRAEIPEILYEAQQQRASGIADAQLGVGSAQAQRSKDRRSGVADAVGTAATIAAMFSDRELKTDVEDIDVDEFLDGVDGKQYKYKKGVDDQMYGVMADDLDNDMQDDLLGERDGYETVDYGKALPGVLASVADLNERLKRLEDK